MAATLHGARNLGGNVCRLQPVSACPDDNEGRDLALLEAAAEGLAQLRPEELHGDGLVVLLEASRWLSAAGVDPTDDEQLAAACSILLELRTTLVACSGLDPHHEPVPLIPRQPRSGIPALVIYLHGLLSRGSHHRRVAPAELAHEAARRVLER